MRLSVLDDEVESLERRVIWTLRVAHLNVAEHNVALAGEVLTLEWNEAVGRDKCGDNWLPVDPPGDRLETSRCSSNVGRKREQSTGSEDSYKTAVKRASAAET